MSVQKKLIERVCDQINTCFSFITTFYTNEKYIDRDYHLLKLESQHLDLLLSLLRGEVSVESAIAEYRLLFSNESFYDFPYEYKAPLLSLEKEEIDIGVIYVGENLHCFINVLQICSDNIKKHISAEQYTKINDEIYYNHNVPWLIRTECNSAIQYYLSTECTECRVNCSEEMVQSYEEAWQEVKKQFPDHDKKSGINSSSSKKQGLLNRIFKK